MSDQSKPSVLADVDNAVGELSTELERLIVPLEEELEQLRSKSDLPPQGSALDLIIKERRRQIMVEGRDADHDDTVNDDHQLARAAACYAMTPFMSVQEQTGKNAPWRGELYWPWDIEWWNPLYNDEEGAQRTVARIRELTKSGALIAAEIDRLQRKLQRQRED